VLDAAAASPPPLGILPAIARRTYAAGAMSSSPHDGLFKAVFGQPEHATGALCSLLPAAVADALDWPTLAPRPGSFIDPMLVGSHTDLLFSVAWRDGGEALVYLVFEHQSTCDPRMAFRLLRYLVRIWEAWLGEHPRAEALPVIVPIVLYHGAEPWSASVEFDALLDIPDAVRLAVAPQLVRFTYLLDDLSEIPDERLRARAMTALGRLVDACFKHARTRADLLEILSGWADVLREVVIAPNGMEALLLVMRYILLVSQHVGLEVLQTFMVRMVPEAKDLIMTAGQRLIEEGLQQGLQQGRQEGRQEREREVLLRLLRQRFGSQVGGDTERRLATAPPERIATWLDRVLSAATLAELLAD